MLHSNERGRTPTREGHIKQDLSLIESRRHSRQELLHQAVNKSSLTRSLTRPPHEKSRGQKRPEFKRWSSYDQAPSEISPFSILEDQYNTKHPVASSIDLSTDNSFRELEKHAPTQTPIKSSLYDKMSNFAHGLFTNGSPSEDSLSDTMETEVNDTQYEIELVESQDSQPDFEEVLRNLALQSSDTITPKLNRTQQKQIDLKDLFQTEHSERAELNYDWRIQNETILSQYTTIRLRFASHQVHRKRMETNIGVLGFIKHHCNYINPTPVALGENDSVIKQIWQDANSIFK